MDKDWAKVPVPQNYGELIANYGDPASSVFESEYIVQYPHFTSDGTLIHVRSHVAIVQRLHNVFLFAGKYIHTYDGCYVVRNVRGMSTRSIHSWGLAIDVNASQNALGSPGTQNEELIREFENQGFFWGGNYHNRKDPMHFQFAGDF